MKPVLQWVLSSNSVKSLRAQFFPGDEMGEDEEVGWWLRRRCPRIILQSRLQIGVVPENEIYSDEVQKGDGVKGGLGFPCNSSLASFE